MPPRERETNALYSDYATKNYPPPGDSTSQLITVSHHPLLTPHYPLLLATSSGGRRTGPPDSAGPAIQSQPSQSSEPPRGREQHRDAESLDTRKEAADALAARYRASRERLGGVGA